MSIKNDDRASRKHPVEPPPQAPPQIEGVFKHPNLAKSVTSLIGNNVKVKTKSGFTYEGVFSTLSSDFEVVVALSHEIGSEDPFFGKVENESIVFKPDDIVSISCVNVNLKEALDMSKRLDFSGDFPTKRSDLWDDRESEPYHKGWSDLLKSHKNRDYGSSDFTEDIRSYSSIYGEVGAETTNESTFDGMDQNYDSRGDYSKAPKKAKTPPDEGLILEGLSAPKVGNDKTSNLNPFAKPFTPMEIPPEKDCGGQRIPPLATVVLPTYVVSSANNSPSKLDGAHQGMSGGGATSLLGGGSLQNQYMQYPYGESYDEKLYSSYDSLPITAHDYQQYYPHLQYIQYFRRFY